MEKYIIRPRPNVSDIKVINSSMHPTRSNQWPNATPDFTNQFMNSDLHDIYNKNAI